MRKPAVKHKLKAAIVSNYVVKNITQAKKIQDQLECKLALERLTHRNKKQCKPPIREYRVYMASRPCGFDPNSDSEEHAS